MSESPEVGTDDVTEVEGLPEDGQGAAGATVPAADGTDEEGVQKYKRRAFIGAIGLTIRTALAQLIILGGTVVLARHLLPAEFGAFAMIQFALTALTVFGDAGLAGALVQKKTAPTQLELSSVFYAQLALSVVVFIVAAGLGELLPLIWPDLPEGSPWILRVLAFSFVLTSARIVPMLLLERELHFVRVSIIDTVNNVAFYLVASVLALADYGIWALVIGVVAQGVASLVTTLAMRPWRPSFMFSWAAVRGLLGFGIPFQARTVLGLVIASVIPVVGGTALGAQSVGFLNWSLQTAFFPLTFVDIIARVSFPLYSRLRDSAAGFAEVLERSMRICITLTLFFAGMFIGLGPELTVIIYSEQWAEAVPLLRLYAATITIGMLVNVLAPAFDALGRPQTVLLQMVFVTVGTWIVVPITTKLWGIEGLVIGFVTVMVLGGGVIVRLARKWLPEVKIAKPYIAPTVACFAIIALGVLVLGPRTTGPLSLAGAVATEVVAFLVIVAILDRGTLAALRTLLPERWRQS